MYSPNQVRPQLDFITPIFHSYGGSKELAQKQDQPLLSATMEVSICVLT